MEGRGGMDGGGVSNHKRDNKNNNEEKRIIIINARQATKIHNCAYPPYVLAASMMIRWPLFLSKTIVVPSYLLCYAKRNWLNSATATGQNGQTLALFEPR